VGLSQAAGWTANTPAQAGAGHRESDIPIGMRKDADMKVFISWSGTQSRGVAEALHWWFPKVLQGVKPFVSAKDIDKGSNWTVELARELEETDFGVVCLTPDNLSSPWLHYETGAITRSVASRVCPLLHGVKKGEVSAPLGQLQLTDLGDQNDMLLMMTSMNAVAGHGLSLEDLRETVEMWWPRLTDRLDKVPVSAILVSMPERTEPEQPGSTDRELLLEVLDAVRHSNSRKLSPPAQALTPEEEASRAVRRALVKDLLAAGVPVRNMLGSSNLWTLLVEELPDTLPALAYSLLSKAAKENEVVVRLRTHGEEGRTVEFDQNGWSDEPPF